MTVVDSFGRQTAIEELGSEVKLGVQDGFSDLDVFRQLYASVFGVHDFPLFIESMGNDLCRCDYSLLSTTAGSSA